MRKISILFCMLLAGITGYSQQRTDSVHAAHYDLALSVVDFENHRVEGRADITLVAKVNNLNQIRLDLKFLTCDSVFVNQSATPFTQSEEHIYINTSAMQSGDTATIRVHYHGTPGHDDGFGGFYYSGEYAYNVGVALTDQPHAYGRCWFPCMDEFTDKSTYSFHIRTEAGKRAVCNGMLTDSLTHDDGTRTWSWELEQPVPTYLVSMAVGDYRCHADTFQGMERVIPIHLYVPPALYANVAGTFANLKPVLRKYEELFGPYVWPRVGYVGVNMAGGAMEHATNIALPNLAVNGTLTYEGTIMHELFHHWFGDLITCERPEEMWINEGFADYSEALVQEWLYDNYADHIRSQHVSTLQNIARKDGGLYALDAVPQDYTYGMHSYQKGGLVIHTLRHHMGDSLFFSSMRQLLSHYAYQNVNSEQFFTYLTQVSGMDLMDFYEDWIHQPGFPDFEVAGVQSQACGIYTVLVKQGGYGTLHPCNNALVDVTFVSDDLETYTYENQLVGGESTELLLYSPFSPAFVMLDASRKLSDATIDDMRRIGAPGTVHFPEAACSAVVGHLDDSALIRVEHHLTAPDAPTPLPEGYHQFSQTHYWTVRYAGGIIDGEWNFRLQRSSNQLDHSLFENGDTFENLKLMYRPDGQSAWMPVPYTRSGSPYNATITTAEMLPGQYCFAMADATTSTNGPQLAPITLYPNPAGDALTVKTRAEQADKAAIYDSNGRRVMVFRIQSDEQKIDTESLSSGSYVIVLYKKGKSVNRMMFVKS